MCRHESLRAIASDLDAGSTGTSLSPGTVPCRGGRSGSLVLALPLPFAADVRPRTRSNRETVSSSPGASSYPYPYP